MTRDQILRRLEQLSDEEFARVAPFVEADLETLEHLDELREEIRAGRESAKSEPLLEADEVFAHARRVLRR